MDCCEHKFEHHPHQLVSADRREGLHRAPLNHLSGSDNCRSEEKFQCVEDCEELCKESHPQEMYLKASSPSVPMEDQGLPSATVFSTP